MKIEKKLWPQYFRNAKAGRERFEVRLADFRCRPGDVMVLREWDPKKRAYTGRKLEKRIAGVTRTRDQKFYTKKDINKYGFQVVEFR